MRAHPILGDPSSKGLYTLSTLLHRWQCSADDSWLPLHVFPVTTVPPLWQSPHPSFSGDAEALFHGRYDKEHTCYLQRISGDHHVTFMIIAASVFLRGRGGTPPRAL
jgi:hypothetical protein